MIIDIPDKILKEAILEKLDEWSFHDLNSYWALKGFFKRENEKVNSRIKEVEEKGLFKNRDNDDIISDEYGDFITQDEDLDKEDKLLDGFLQDVIKAVFKG